MSRHPSAHPAGQAVTVHEAVDIAAPLRAVAEAANYPRAAGGAYRVVRDCTAHQGVGLYRVFVGAQEIGRQTSMPGAEDCARLERGGDWPAASAPFLSYRARRDASLERASRRGGRALRIKRPA